MNNRVPPGREMKIRAKRLMIHPMVVRATLLMVCIQMAVFGVRYLMDANLTYALVNLANYADTTTGIYPNAEGFSIIFRMDLTQMVLAIPLTYRQITLFLVMGAAAVVILSPLRVGTMEQYWSILRDQPRAMSSIGQWYKQPGRLGKAVVVEFVLQILVRLVGIVASVPSLYLYYQFYTNVKSMDDLTALNSLTQTGASLLAIVAAVFCFWLHSVFLPVRYCLAAHPEYSLGEVFRRGLASTKGYRGGFFRFRFSMVIWFFLSQTTYNALDLYVLPYSSLASMVYVQEVARARQAKPQEEVQEISE